MSQDAVPVMGARGAVEIQISDVYFAFPNGRFSYDCVACGAHCCKGFGFQLRSGHELEEFVLETPALAAFLENVRSDEHARVANCPPGCFFLTEGNACRIHVDRGFHKKPETCRLFPFNNFRLAGGHLIVAPHPGLCPLQVVSPPSSSDASRYHLLLSELQRSGVTQPVQELALTRSECVRLVALEREIMKIAEATDAREGYSAFAAAQLSASGYPGDSARVLGDFRSEIFAILGLLPPPALNPKQVEMLLAVTPVLRAQWIFRHDAEAVTESWLWRVPRMLIALEVFFGLAAAAGMLRIDYQTSIRLASELGPLLELLALSDSHVTLEPSADIPWPFPGPPKAARAYLSVVRRIASPTHASSADTLGTVLDTTAPHDGVERVLFLKGVSKALAGRLLERHAKRSPAYSPKAILARLRRWVILQLGDEGFERVASRIARSAEKKSIVEGPAP